MVWAAGWTPVNKFADDVPELLIGVAIDVIVRGDASFGATRSASTAGSLARAQSLR